MEPRITVVTLGVADLERSVRFYRDGLGFPTNHKNGEPIAFFSTNGVRLALYPLDKLAEDISPSLQPVKSRFSGITLAHNTRTKEQVSDRSLRDSLPIDQFILSFQPLTSDGM